jgi:hypothetical protein
MGRRGQECRCCGPCEGCSPNPSLMRASIAYPSGSGVTLFADSNPANDPPEWEDVTTDCSIEPARRYVRRVRITEPGTDYTVSPTLSITGGGGSPLLDAWIEITSPVIEIEVIESGSGYTKAPAVTLTGGGKIQTVTAKAVIEGKITSLTLTDPGEGYENPPEVVVLGGQGATIAATMDGYLIGIAITDGGEGYTSAPSVTLSGGGGSGASAKVGFSKDSGVVTEALVLTKGEGYTSPPSVVLSGGGGEGAQALATLAYQVKSLAVTDGGNGYPFDPTVTFNAPAFRSAVASAAIEGKVVSVSVETPGLYRHRRNAVGAVLIDWPTVSIAGSATAEPRFSGKVTAIDTGQIFGQEISDQAIKFPPPEGAGYTSTPTVTIAPASGDNGSGAAAVAEMNWLAEHEQTAEFEGCRAFLQTGGCYFASSELFPVVAQTACNTGGELFAWIVEARTDLGLFASQNVLAAPISLGSPWTAGLIRFEGEGAIVQVRRAWESGYVDILYDCFPGSAPAREEVIDFFVARKFSRVPPEVTYAIKLPQQPKQTTNAIITPEWTQYVDAKGDSFWHLESLSVTNGGQNLHFPPNHTLRISANGNAVHEFEVFQFEFSRQVPEAEIDDLESFSVQPTATIFLAAIGLPAGTFYRISGVSITSGGQTNAADGAVTVPVLLTKGHWNAGPISLAGVISGGQLSSVELPAASQQIISPATLASVDPQNDPNFANSASIATGRSPFEVTYNHAAPTVTAKAVSTGNDAVFNVTLAAKADLNGDEFWEIESAIATAVGTEHASNSAIVIEVDSPGIEAVPPVLQVIRDRAPPSLVVRTVAPILSVVLPTLQVELTEQAGEFGDPYWEITNVTATAETALASFLGPGAVPTGGTFGFYLEGDPSLVQAAAYGGCRDAVISYTVADNGNGVLVFSGVQIEDGGNYFLETDGIRRLHVLNGGRFFEREFNVSSNPLPTVSCIGPVSTSAGWSKNRVLYQIGVGTVLDRQVAVNESYGLEFADRVRRCPLPQIEVDLE